MHTSARDVLAEDPGDAIVNEPHHHPYQLVVLGAVDRGDDYQIYLGSPVQSGLTETRIPAVLLVSHERTAGEAAAAA